MYSMMTSYKRKRIETWCEEVAQYLKNGTICRSVIGHVAEDAINGNAVNSSAADETAIREDLENVDVNGTRITLEPKNDGLTKQNNIVSTKGDERDSFGSSINMIGNSFPAVKFAYSHYHEQRRKIDRLVQGLPVLHANLLNSADRPSSRSSLDDQTPIIIVNGEEPVRHPQPRSRSSSQPRRHPQHVHLPYSHAHFASVNHAALHQLHAPHTARQLATPFRSQSQPRTNSFEQHLHRSRSGASRLYDNGPAPNHDVAVTVDPALGLTANERIARSKTAPGPNRNVTRARQRILTRRPNKILDHTSALPMQSCWAMAELTW